MSTDLYENGHPGANDGSWDGSWHRGDWIQTFTGKKFYPTSPDPDDVDIVDIAHALSMLCRYAGHVDRFYSVAEHCVLMSRWIEQDGIENEVSADEIRAVALQALLHDATEAYCVDVPRPLKVQLPQYQEAEAKIALAVAEHFELPMIRDSFGVVLRPDEHPMVKTADTRILLDERAALMSATRHVWGVDSLEPLGVSVQGWIPKRAEENYLMRFGELTS